MSLSRQSFPMLILVFSLLLCFTLSYSQNQKKADSLLQVLIEKNNLSKEDKANLFLDIAYYHPNIDSSLLLSNQAPASTRHRRALAGEPIKKKKEYCLFRVSLDKIWTTRNLKTSTI